MWSICGRTGPPADIGLETHCQATPNHKPSDASQEAASVSTHLHVDIIWPLTSQSRDNPSANRVRLEPVEDVPSEGALPVEEVATTFCAGKKGNLKICSKYVVVLS